MLLTPCCKGSRRSWNVTWSMCSNSNQNSRPGTGEAKDPCSLQKFRVITFSDINEINRPLGNLNFFPPALVDIDVKNVKKIQQTNSDILLEAHDAPISDVQLEGNSPHEINKLTTETDTATSDDSSLSQHQPEPEVALCLDHILEQVLSSLTSSQLRNCRLVSHRWNSFATSLLRKLKQFQLKFSDGDKLQMFVLLLRQHSSPRGLLSFSPFPCSNFIFENKCCEPNFSSNLYSNSVTFSKFLCNKLVREIFSTHGFYISEISLNFRDLSQSQSSIPTETGIMKEIRNIIIYQAPNVTKLKLSLSCKIDWKENLNANSNGNGSLRSYNSPLLQSDPEFDEIHSKYSRSSKVNKQLKVIDVSSHHLSSKLLEMIILLAPNLSEIIPNMNYQHYLIQPLNRLHFLKKLWFKQHQFVYMNDHIETYERIADASEGGEVELRDIFICLPHPHLTFQSKSFYGPPEMTSRVVHVLSRILNANRNSLEFIEWAGATFPEHSNLNFPQVMPKIKKIRFTHAPNLCTENLFLFSKSKYERSATDTDDHGFWSWTSVFPNIESVSLCDMGKRNGRFMNFIQCLHLNLTPTDAVKKLLIHTKQMVTEEHRDLLKTLFPSARVVIVDVCDCVVVTNM